MQFWIYKDRYSKGNKSNLRVKEIRRASGIIFNVVFKMKYFSQITNSQPNKSWVKN